MATRTADIVGYGINFEMRLIGGAKTSQEFEQAGRAVENSLNKTSHASKQHELRMETLKQAYEANAISQQEYNEQRNRLLYKEKRRLEQIEKERRSVLGLDRQEKTLHHNRQRRARLAGMLASGVSGLGFGGRAAGAARFLGGSMGMGMGLMGLGFGAVTILKESLSAFTKLEASVTGLKSLFGEDLGSKLTAQFQSLARTTILTNNQLIENAKTWASYGLTTEGLTDRLKRLGTVAGGNSEKFKALTVAFAQVNAQGKLMGQEKNQLINAGFSLQAVAEAAGISMEEFADSMKKGEITADHLNEALIKVTSEGGMFAGYLEKQAETIEGKMTVLSSSWEKFLQVLGKSAKGPASAFLDKLIQAADSLSEIAQYWSSGLSVFTGGVAAEKRLPEASIFKGAGVSAFVDDPYSKESKMYGGLNMYNEDVLIRQLQEKFNLDKEDATRLYELRFKNIVENNAADKGRREAQEKVDKALAEAQKRREKERAELENQMYEDIRKNYNLTQQEFANAVANFDPEGPIGKKAMEEFLSRPFTQGGEGFVGPMLGSRKDQEARLEGLEKEEQKRIEFEQAAAEAAEEHEKDKHKREMDLLKLEEKAVEDRLKAETKVASGLDAMFTGGSVEEFMFLRRQTQASEAAKATKEAEDRAQEQRDRIAEQRKILDERLATALENINEQFNLNTGGAGIDREFN